MTSKLLNVVLNAADPFELAGWWSKVTGRPLADDDDPGDPEASILLASGVTLFFQHDPQPKSGRNRLHVCLQPDDPRDEEVERLVGIGARLVDDRRDPDGTGWAVLADPEDNEFCVLRSAAERAATEPA